MPITEKRKIYKTRAGTLRLNPPKGWGDFFRIQGGEKLETITDAPFIAFPNQVKTREQKIEALMKIVKLLETASEEISYPEAAKKGRMVKKEVAK